MKRLFYLLLFALIAASPGYAQVGIGTVTPRGALEISSGPGQNLGIVIPRVLNLPDVINPHDGALPAPGTIVFDDSRGSLAIRGAGGWRIVGPDLLDDFIPDNPGPIPTYIKASNTERSDLFGWSVSLSKDGNTLAVGAYGEDSGMGIDGNQGDNSAHESGAVYVFVRSGDKWVQQAYIKAFNVDAWDWFGWSVSLSADGNTLAVGAYGEDSPKDTDEGSNTAVNAGAVYVFMRSGSLWTQQAFLKASNADARDRFGSSISLSADGKTLVVGAPFEDSNATGIGGNQMDNSAVASGAVYVFTLSGATWGQPVYLKASNTDPWDHFGHSVSLSADGNTLAVGACREASSGSGKPENNDVLDSGAAYVFTRSGDTWAQQAYIKASNIAAMQEFGWSVSLSADGNTLAVGAYGERSGVTGIYHGTASADVSSPGAGAVYVFIRIQTFWGQQAYIKASNTDRGDYFGWSVSLSADGSTLAVGAWPESSGARGIDGDQADNSAYGVGAVYVFTRDGATWAQQAYIKPSMTRPSFQNKFGYSVSLSANGNTLAAGSLDEPSGVYIFMRSGTTWREDAIIRSIDEGFGSIYLGGSVSLSDDGNKLAGGDLNEGSAAIFERDLVTGRWSRKLVMRKGVDYRRISTIDRPVCLSGNGKTVARGNWVDFSGATGIDGDDTDVSAPSSGAVWVHELEW